MIFKLIHSFKKCRTYFLSNSIPVIFQHDELKLHRKKHQDDRWWTCHFGTRTYVRTNKIVHGQTTVLMWLSFLLIFPRHALFFQLWSCQSIPQTKMFRQMNDHSLKNLLIFPKTFPKFNQIGSHSWQTKLVWFAFFVVLFHFFVCHTVGNPVDMLLHTGKFTSSSIFNLFFGVVSCLVLPVRFKKQRSCSILSWATMCCNFLIFHNC